MADEKYETLEDLYDNEEENFHTETPIEVDDNGVVKLGEKQNKNPISVPIDDDDEENEDEWTDDDDEHNHNGDEENENDENEELEQNDIITSLLKMRGIENPDEIQYLNDNDEIERVKFSDLPLEDQLNILKGTPDYNDDEIQTINFLRENDISFEDAVKYYQRKAVEEYIASNTEQQYSIDDFSNDELFIADLREKFPEMTQEELTEALELEQSNPSLFEKKMSRLRQEYKSLEDAALEEAKAAEESQRENEYNQFKSSILNAANNIENIGGIDLELQDKEEIASFILARDPNNQTKLSKALADPENVFKVAWFLSKGPEAFDMLHNYYENELKKKSRQVSQPSSQSKNVKPEKKSSLSIKGGDKSGKKYFTLDDLDH